MPICELFHLPGTLHRIESPRGEDADGLALVRARYPEAEAQGSLGTYSYTVRREGVPMLVGEAWLSGRSGWRLRLADEPQPCP